MPRVGGVFSLVASYFATDGGTIEIDQHNPVLEDIEQALTDSLPRDGSAAMTGALAMGSAKITGLANGTASGDAVNKSQLDATQSAAAITGGTIDGAVIGGTTPAALSATTADFTGNVTVTEATPNIRITDTDNSGYTDLRAGASSPTFIIDVDPTAADASSAFLVRVDAMTIVSVGPSSVTFDVDDGLIVDKSASGQSSRIWGSTNGSNRWALDLGNADAESGSDAGSNFQIKRYDDSGTFIEDALEINRDDGQTLLHGELTMTDDDKIAWDAGPSINVGSGTPEGSLTAPVGSLYLRSDGGASTSLYVKESGSGNTGWVAK